MVDILYKGKFYPNESPFKSCHACHSISKRNWIYMKSLAAEVLPNRNQHFHDFFLTSTFSFQLKWGNWTPTCSKNWKNDMPHLNRWNQSEYQMFIHTPKKKSVHIPLLCICCTKLQQIKIWLCIHTSYILHYRIKRQDRTWPCLSIAQYSCNRNLLAPHLVPKHLRSRRYPAYPGTCPLNRYLAGKNNATKAYVCIMDTHTHTHTKHVFM